MFAFFAFSQTMLLQLNIIGRNSGFYYAMTFRHLDTYVDILLQRKGLIKRHTVNMDPLYTLQFLARVRLSTTVSP